MSDNNIVGRRSAVLSSCAERGAPAVIRRVSVCVCAQTCASACVCVRSHSGDARARSAAEDVEPTHSIHTRIHSIHAEHAHHTHTFTHSEWPQSDQIRVGKAAAATSHQPSHREPKRNTTASPLPGLSAPSTPSSSRARHDGPQQSAGPTRDRHSVLFTPAAHSQ